MRPARHRPSTLIICKYDKAAGTPGGLFSILEAAGAGDIGRI